LLIQGFSGVRWGETEEAVRKLHGDPRKVLKDFEALEFLYDDELAGLEAYKIFLLHERFGLITGRYIAETDADAGPQAFADVILALGDKYPALNGVFSEGGLRYTLVDPSGTAQIDSGYVTDGSSLFVAYNGPHCVEWLIKREKHSKLKRQADLRGKL